MSTNERALRVVIALTESSPVAELWDAAMQAISSSQAELIAVYLHDERWQRAASLPFTREVSTAGGTAADFTLQRAEQLLADSVSRLKTRIDQLAKRTGVPVAFQVMAESDQAQVRTILGAGTSIVVGPSILSEHPVFIELRRLDLRLLLIE